MEGKYLVRELQDHFPYSIFFTALGILLAAILCYISIVTGAQAPPPTHEHVHEHATAGADTAQHKAEAEPPASLMVSASGVMFHIFHPLHLMLSAMATVAMFWRYDKKLVKAVITGTIGSVGVCGLSDAFMPYLSGRMLDVEHMHFHWCLIEHPWTVIPFVILGIITGIISAETVQKSTLIAHSSHVFVSSAASLFYLISFGVTTWFHPERLPYVFTIIVLCVTVPCCLSDIVFPLLLATPRRCMHCHHGPDEEPDEGGPHAD